MTKALCPDCGGEGCRQCDNRGWVPVRLKVSTSNGLCISAQVGAKKSCSVTPRTLGKFQGTTRRLP